MRLETTRITFYHFLLSILLGLALAQLGLAEASQSRESIFASWSSEVLRPWFQSEADQFIESKVISKQTVRLRYKSFRRSQPKANIVLVHGYGERIEKFAEIAYDFHQAGYSVYLLDQRGFGQSGWLNPEGTKAIYVERFENYASDIEQFIEGIVKPRSSSRPVFIFAHSMGGLVSSLVIHDRPELVDAAVLSAPMMSPQTSGVPVTLTRHICRLADFLGFGSRYVFGQTDPKPSVFTNAATQSLARWKDYAEFIQQPSEWTKARGGASFHWLGESLRISQKVSEETWASSIDTPILIFQADHDTYVENEAQNLFCAQVRDCRKIFMPGTRHEIYREQDSSRVLYMNAMLAFFDKQTQSRQQFHMARP